jgi:hypothetical protein
MKKNLTKMLAVSGIGLLLLPACKKSGDLATSNGGKAGTLSASATTLPLNKAQINDSTTIINFSFTKANYGYSAAVTNTLQIDIPGDNWKNPTSATLVNGVYSQGFNTAAFNNLVLKLNVPAGVATPIVARVQQSISGQIAPIYSNTLSLNVTAFNLTSWVYVPGAYEGSSWPNPGPQEDSLESVTGNGIYVGIINFPAGDNQFLIVPAKNWLNKWATSAPATNPTGTSVTYPVVYNGPNNFYAPVAPGYYLVTLNTNTNQLTIVPADYYSVIGDAALGWNAGDDVPMKFINDGTNTWLASNVAMSVELPPNDGFKIRQDDAWGSSWGTSGTAGILTSASGNVNIGISTAGNYNVTFGMPPTPFGSAPATTAPYTLVKQ